MLYRKRIYLIQKKETQEIIENSNSKLDKKMNLVSLKNTENLEKNTSLIPQLSLDKNKSSGPQTNSFEQKDNKHKKKFSTDSGIRI